MVGSDLRRVSSTDDSLLLHQQQERQYGWKHRSSSSPSQAFPQPVAPPPPPPQTSWHHPRAHSKQHYTAESAAGKRGGQRAGNGVENRLGGGNDVPGRVSLSSASSSGRLPHSNLECFLDVTTPRVKPQTLRKSCFRDPSQKRCFDPEVTPFFSLGDLWDSFDEWSAYGAGVPLMLHGYENVVQYYVPYLSALQLYTIPTRRPHVAAYRAPGVESDEGSDASSDGENESSMGPGRNQWQGRVLKNADSSSSYSSLGSGPRLECSTFVNGDDEDVEVWSYFETSPPYSRVPLVDKITDLSRDFEPQYNPLRILRSVDLLPNSWLSVAWYPIYRIPTGPTLRDLAACFLTYHSLSTPMNGTSGVWMNKALHVPTYPLNSAEGARQLPSCSEPCDMPTLCSRETSRLELRAFGLTSYKLRGALWTSNVERRQATLLQNSASVHLKQLDVEHPDYIFFTSHSNSRR